MDVNGHETIQHYTKTELLKSLFIAEVMINFNWKLNSNHWRAHLIVQTYQNQRRQFILCLSYCLFWYTFLCVFVVYYAKCMYLCNYQVPSSLSLSLSLSLWETVYVPLHRYSIKLNIAALLIVMPYIRRHCPYRKPKHDCITHSKTNIITILLIPNLVKLMAVLSFLY